MSDTQKIQWDQPLEAVHEDGRVVSAQLVEQRANHNLVHWDEDEGWWFTDRGTVSGTPWTIRNVAPKEVEWGAEVFVYNRKPDWLSDGEPFRVWEARSVGDLNGPCEGYYWNEVTAIVLPADHEHYKKAATPTRTALEQRMEDFVRRVAALPRIYEQEYQEATAEARAIVAELPEPVSPDRLEAKRLAVIWVISEDAAYEILSRGRALERGE